jgi:NADPH:quinone reductase-like Zn-dependent oxidoreductase
MFARGHEPGANVIAQLEAFGLDNVVIRARPLQRLGPADIRVRIHAASLNHRDLLIARGEYSPVARLPLILLSDCAGEVVATGRDVRRFEISDRVVAAPLPAWLRGPFAAETLSSAPGSRVDGVLGQYFTGDQHSFVSVPKEFSFEEAATLPYAALTAWNALFEGGNLKPGKTVLVQGSGGVSIFALQFAVAAGARVIATTSSDMKSRALRELGAAHVVNWRQQCDWSRQVLELTGGSGVDHIIETGGSGTLDQSIKSAAVGGSISVIGMLTGASGTFDTLPILKKTLTLQGIVAWSVEMLERMIGTLEALQIRPVIDRTFEMQDIVSALKYLESGRHVGKVVIRVGEMDLQRMDEAPRYPGRQNPTARASQTGIANSSHGRFCWAVPGRR